MKEAKTTSGKTYVVTSPNGCTVTQHAGKATIYTKVPAHVQTLVVAQTSKLEISDDYAVVTEVFNLAPAPAGQGEGGGLPAGYTRVEWLESQNGVINNCSYIKLPFYFENQNSTLRIETLHAMPETALASDNAELSNSGPFIFWGVRKSGLKYYGFPNLVLVDGSQQVEGFNKKSLIFRNDKLQFFENDELQCEKTGLGSYSFETLSVFSAYGGNNYPFLGRKKYFKVWINVRIVYDLVPCLDPTGAPCMFDMVSRICYYNEGTGDFLYPGKEEEPATFSRRRPITYAQLTEHGVRRLYRVPAGYNGTKDEYAMEHGFKPLVESEKPEEGYWMPRWTETEDEIVLEWIETEAPEQEEITHEA